MVDFKAIMVKNDPRRYRLSDNFVLSDFLGNHSVYSRGLVNAFEFTHANDFERKIANVKALCMELEILMAHFGGVSIGYGYIAPETSRALVTYQDPNKPSHHRFDLGAAADVVFHDWVQEKKNYIPPLDLFICESARGSPIALAHGIDMLQTPYSRMITYSESPYLCLAVSAEEVAAQKPRRAFYENRFTGVPKAKADYRTYSSDRAKLRAFDALRTEGLEHPWEGAGYPTYHGGGRYQYHHRRVSKHCMVSDFLFDLKSIANGWKNIPSLNDGRVLDAFAAAGLVYDRLCITLGVPRLSVIQGYVSHINPGFDENNDWRSGHVKYIVNLPQDADANKLMYVLDGVDGVTADNAGIDDGLMQITINTDFVLETWQ